MEISPNYRTFPSNASNGTNPSPDTYTFPPWLFQHQELLNHIKGCRILEKKKLINALNHIHFLGGQVFAYLAHPKYTEGIILKTVPEPCFGNTVTYKWNDKTLFDLDLEYYPFRYLVILYGNALILAPARLQEINRDFFTAELPEASYILDRRKTKRYICHEILAEMHQSGLTAKGKLIDFSPLGLRIRLNPSDSANLHWFNVDVPTNVQLKNDRNVILSATSHFIRQQYIASAIEIVLEPSQNQITRFQKRKIRSPRHQISPQPTLIFTHPLFNKKIKLEVYDISNSGFSVFEQKNEGVLIPGLIIPDVSIEFSGVLSINCSAQVIYREEKEENIKCGLAILDADINAYNNLTQILSQNIDNNVYISNKVDMDALWEFFFDTGFIYPQKYQFIQAYRKEFQETYEKLYQQKNNIAVHFTYEKSGKIFGHIAILKAYQKAWMIHHYAARPIGIRLTGFLILKELMKYLNGLYRLPSAQMNYVFTYYRPNNRIVEKIFGGFAGHLADPNGCSIDTFAYIPLEKEDQLNELPHGWTVTPSSSFDIWHLNIHYRHNSGGLMLNALDLAQDPTDHHKDLEQEFRQYGLQRKCKTYSLKYHNRLTAIFIVNRAEMGINLSELLNGFKIVILDQSKLPWEILKTAVLHLSHKYGMDKISLLIFPHSYLDQENVHYEKKYQMWILDIARYGNRYIEYMHKNFRIRFP